MNDIEEKRGLVRGLRALEILARHAPLDLGSFGRLNGLVPAKAATLIRVFETHGFAASRGALYVPTRLTLRVVASAPVARLWH